MFRLVLVKQAFVRNSQPRGRPHVSDVNVLMSIVVHIKPACAHSCTDILNIGLTRNCFERSISVVAIKITASEIVCHVQVWPSIGVQVAPGTGKTVAVIVDVQSCFIGSVVKGRITSVMKQEVRRAIACVEVGSGIMILIETDVVVVNAEVNIKMSVPIVIGNRSLRETPLRGARKLKGIAFDGILSHPLIKEEEWATFGNDQQVL